MSSIMKGLVGEGDVIQGPWKKPYTAQEITKLASEFPDSRYFPQDLKTKDIKNIEIEIQEVAESILRFLLEEHKELYDKLDDNTRDLLSKEISQALFMQLGLLDEALEENLNKWFKEKWVRFGPDGKIRGDCARGDDSEGKPKCLPQKKAQNLGKKGRKYAASKKRREDPNPDRTGKAKNVATKKKTNEEQLDELNCWSGYSRVQGVPAGAPGSCKKKTNEEDGEKCPHCGGELVSEEMMNEKQDACYRKVKSRYKVWPSAYASGALVQCRKKGASNWGTGGKKDESTIMKGIVDEAGNPAQQAAIAIAMKKSGKKPKNEATYTSSGDAELALEEAYREARQITKQIKYDQTVSKILGSIQMLAQKVDIAEEEFQDAENEVYAASNALESAVYGLDEVFKEALERQRYAQDDEDFISEVKGKPYVKPDYDKTTGTQIGWKSSNGYRPKFWRLAGPFPPKEAYEHAKISPDEVQEDYSGMYAAEKTPKINPYAGIKEREFRGPISETPTDNPTGASGAGGWRTYRAKPAGEIEEDTAYAGGMGQGGNAGQSYRKFKPKMAGVIKKESSIMKGLRNEGR